MIEERIKRFQELCNNKWFYIMNWVLDEIRIIFYKKKNNKDRFMHVKYAKVFYL